MPTGEAQPRVEWTSLLRSLERLGDAQIRTTNGAATAPEPRSEFAELLTAAQVGARWQVQRSQIYNLTRSGLLPVVKLGRYQRYRVADIEHFEAGGGAA